MPNAHDVLFRTLADPTRRAIFERLCRKGEQTVGSLTARAGVSQPAVSKHLGVLKHAGLVRDRREGRQTHYSAQPQGLAPLVVETVMGTIRELKRERVSMLLVEQNAEMALGLADRVYVIDHGTIVFEGSEVQSLSPNALVRQGCIQVMEGRHCFAHLTVEENLIVSFLSARASMSAAEAMAGVYELFPRLAERRRQAGGTLSGGEQQRVALGRAGSGRGFGAEC